MDPDVALGDPVFPKGPTCMRMHGADPRASGQWVGAICPRMSALILKRAERRGFRRSQNELAVLEDVRAIIE